MVSRTRGKSRDCVSCGCRPMSRRIQHIPLLLSLLRLAWPAIAGGELPGFVVPRSLGGPTYGQRFAHDWTVCCYPSVQQQKVARAVQIEGLRRRAVGAANHRRVAVLRATRAEPLNTPAAQLSETEIYLLEYVGVEPVRLAQLMDSKPFPNLRDKSLSEDIRPCIQFLLEEVGLPRKSLGKALVTCPQLLGVGIASLKSGLEFLCSLGITRDACSRVVERFPHILKYSVEANLRPSADFLKRELAISPSQLAFVVEKEPACLQVAHSLVPFLARSLARALFRSLACFLYLVFSSLSLSLSPILSFFLPLSCSLSSPSFACTLSLSLSSLSLARSCSLVSSLSPRLSLSPSLPPFLPPSLPPFPAPSLSLVRAACLAFRLCCLSLSVCPSVSVSISVSSGPLFCPIHIRVHMLANVSTNSCTYVYSIYTRQESNRHPLLPLPHTPVV